MKGFKRPTRFAQRGLVLMIMFLVLFMAGASLFITYASNSVSAISTQSNIEAVVAMRNAKEALIAYGITHGDYFGATGAGPGHLPCPDTNDDGEENLPCGLNPFGRLPQSVVVPQPVPDTVLLLSDYNYGLDEELWYRVDDIVGRTSGSVFNSNSTTGLTLNGQSNIAAVLIAPGPALGAQTRPSNDEANYLEGANEAGTDFLSSEDLGPDEFNDRVLGITVAEIIAPVTTRVAESLRMELENFHDANARFPSEMATDLNDPKELQTVFDAAPAWLTDNEWDTVTQYTRTNDNTVTFTFTGCNGISYTLDRIADTLSRTGIRC